MVIYRNLTPKLMAHLLLESAREYARLRQPGKQAGDQSKTQAAELVAPVSPRSRGSTN